MIICSRATCARNQGLRRVINKQSFLSLLTAHHPSSRLHCQLTRSYGLQLGSIAMSSVDPMRLERIGRGWIRDVVRKRWRT